MVEEDDRNLRETEELGCFVASMTGSNLPVPVNQNGRIEAERLDASGDGADLRPTVFGRVVRGGVEVGDREKGELLERGFSLAANCLFGREKLPGWRSCLAHCYQPHSCIGRLCSKNAKLLNRPNDEASVPLATRGVCFFRRFSLR